MTTIGNDDWVMVKIPHNMRDRLGLVDKHARIPAQELCDDVLKIGRCGRSGSSGEAIRTWERSDFAR